eukprot:gene5718-8734_t
MYIVRGVNSGDTLTVLSPDQKNEAEPKLVTISISNVKVPKMGRFTQDEGTFPDEEYAWEAREFVRSRVIGKSIKFIKEAYIEQLGRDVGEIMYQEDGQTKNLGVALAEAGLAELNVKGGAVSDYVKALAEAGVSAIENLRGKYGDDGKDHRRKDAKWDVSPDDLKKIGSMRGEKMQAIVENVFAGHAVRLCLLPHFLYVPAQLTGVVCDKRVITQSERTGPSNADKELWEACHVQAKGLTDRLLRHKEVTVVIDGVQFDSLQVTVMSGDKVFQEELLNRGLAKIFDMTVAMAGPRDRLRAAEQKAKENKVGRWKNFTAAQLVTAGDKAAGDKPGEPAKLPKLADFTGTVLQCVSADTYLVLNDATGEEMRLGLASVRGGGSPNQDAPKPKPEGDGEQQVRQSSNSQASTFARMQRMDAQGIVVFQNFYREGRDFACEQVLGKKVKVKCDFMSKVPEGPQDIPNPQFTIRPAVSIYYDGDKNIGAEVVRAGWAVPIFSKDGQAEDVFKYTDAFQEARDAKRGLHGKKPVEVKVQDMTRPDDDKRGKAMLNYFQRASSGGAGVPKLKAYVEMVMSPSRLRVFVERENVIISLNIAGIASPQMPLPNTNDGPDPLAQEAALFTKKRLLQREVEVEIEHYGMRTFVGNVYLNGKSFAVDLLAEGYATTLGQNTNSMSCKQEAEAAEETAKKNGKGIHTAGFPKKVARTMEKSSNRDRAAFVIGDQKQVPASVTEVVDSTHFFFQTSENKENMKKVEKLIAVKNPEGLASSNEIPYGTMVCARFSQDKRWYRARVTKVHSNKKVDVFFFDYGNRETLPISE